MLALIVIYRLFSLVVLWVAFLPLVASTALSGRRLPGQLQLNSVSEVCDVFGNQVYPSTSRSQPRVIAKACIVLGVSYANFQQSLSSLLSLCTAGCWSCNCSFSLSPRNWCGVLKKVKKVYFCWVAFTIDNLTRTPQDYPDYAFNQCSPFSLRGFWELSVPWKLQEAHNSCELTPRVKGVLSLYH